MMMRQGDVLVMRIKSRPKKATPKDRDGGRIGAKLIHTDETGALYRKDLTEDEPLVVVHVVNSTPEPDGEAKKYMLRVPPTITKAREAVAWTFGLKPNEYRPEIET